MEGVIRRLTVGDRLTAGRVVAIQRAAYAVEAELIGYDAIPPLNETVDDLLETSQLDWKGAFVGATLVGIVAWRLDEETLDIDRLAIDPAFARRGYGTRLLESLPEAPVTTVSTGAANGPARALYEGLGYSLIDEFELNGGLLIVRYQKVSAPTAER